MTMLLIIGGYLLIGAILVVLCVRYDQIDPNSRSAPEQAVCVFFVWIIIVPVILVYGLMSLLVKLGTKLS